MTVAAPARQPETQLELDGQLLHQPDPEPTRALCFHCLRPILKATVNDEEIVADMAEWLPRGECLSCAHTRHSHPGSHVDCKRCGGLGMVGEPRPPGHMLAVDVAWGDTLHVRVIGPKTDRRRGEALYPIHCCGSEDYR